MWLGKADAVAAAHLDAELFLDCYVMLLLTQMLLPQAKLLKKLHKLNFFDCPLSAFISSALTHRSMFKVNAILVGSALLSERKCPVCPVIALGYGVEYFTMAD